MNIHIQSIRCFPTLASPGCLPHTAVLPQRKEAWVDSVNLLILHSAVWDLGLDTPGEVRYIMCYNVYSTALHYK